MPDESTPTPAPISDRPMSLIDILDGSFAVLRQRPRTIVTLIAALVIPLSLIEGWAIRNTLGGASFEEVLNDPSLAQNTGSVPLGPTILIYVSDWLVAAIAGVPMALIVGGWVAGRDIGVREAATTTAKRMPTILGAFILIHLAEAIGMVLLVFPGLVALVFFSMTSPVIALENLGPIAAMKRSMALARRRPGTVIGVMVLVGLVAYGISNVIELVPAIGALVIGPDRAWPLVSIAALLSSIIMVPVTAASMTLLYFDIRFRTEGLDLQLRSQAVQAGTAP